MADDERLSCHEALYLLYHQVWPVEAILGIGLVIAAAGWIVVGAACLGAITWATAKDKLRSCGIGLADGEHTATS